jgi:hypothetical protein
VLINLNCMSIVKDPRLRFNNSLRDKLGKVLPESDISQGNLYIGLKKNLGLSDLRKIKRVLHQGLCLYLEHIKDNRGTTTVPFRRPFSQECFESGKPEYIDLPSEINPNDPRSIEIMHTRGYRINPRKDSNRTERSIADVIIEDEIDKLSVIVGESVPKRQQLYRVYQKILLQ